MDDYSPRQRKLKKKKRLGYSAIAVSALLVVGAAWYVFAGPSSKSLDSKLCPSEEGPSSVQVVIVDATDPYNPVQWQNVKNRLLSVKENVPKHGLLSIFSVTKDLQRTLRPEVELCNPGSGEDLSIWTDNPELARRKWREGFIGPVDSTLSAINFGEPRSRSPIMEAIQAAKARVGAYDTSDRKLLIVSDLMQHSEAYSQYGTQPPNYDSFESTAAARKLGADLSGWEVEILYARRSGTESQVQGRSHVDFWDRYFMENGATLQRVKSIDG